MTEDGVTPLGYARQFAEPILINDAAVNAITSRAP
jgi:hypothetical protein